MSKAENIQVLIISSILTDENYAFKIFPHLKKEFFDVGSQNLYLIIAAYLKKYEKFPPLEAVHIILEKTKMVENIFNSTKEFFEECEFYIKNKTEQDYDWLIDETENFCKEKSYKLAVIEAVNSMEKPEIRNKIPEIITQSLSLTFDNSVGHSFSDDYEKQFENFYQTENSKSRIPFCNDDLNEITHNGLQNGTLTVLLAASGTGKSAMMAAMASDNLRDGYNVLIISLEMGEFDFRHRIDANLCNIPQDRFFKMTKEEYYRKIDMAKKDCLGRLVIKRYPTSSASTLHFKTLIQELKSKQKFVPNIIYIDYLNIAASSTLNSSSKNELYSWNKSISEEFRALAAQADVPIVTAAQVGKAGYKNSDIDMEHVAESRAINDTADIILGLYRDKDDVSYKNKIMIKHIKNRYFPVEEKRKFYVGFDFPRAKLFPLQDSTFTEEVKDKDDGFSLEHFGTKNVKSSKRFSDIPF